MDGKGVHFTMILAYYTVSIVIYYPSTNKDNKDTLCESRPGNRNITYYPRKENKFINWVVANKKFELIYNYATNHSSSDPNCPYDITDHLPITLIISKNNNNTMNITKNHKFSS